MVRVRDARGQFMSLGEYAKKGGVRRRATISGQPVRRKIKSGLKRLRWIPESIRRWLPW